MNATRVAMGCALFASMLLISSSLQAADADPAGVEFFEKSVRPLLIAKCYKCHSADKEKRGELVLDTKAGWAGVRGS